MGTLWGRVSAWARRQRAGAGTLMFVYVTLYTAVLSLGAPGLPAGGVRADRLPLFLFLAWRVSRGGWFSRGLLIVATGLTYLAALLDLARAWDAPVFIMVVVYAVLLVLVLSPPVYRRTHRDRAERSLRPLAWPQPPVWLLLGAVVGGIIVTLCYLSSMDFQPVPGCATSPGRRHRPDRSFERPEWRRRGPWSAGRSLRRPAPDPSGSERP